MKKAYFTLNEKYNGIEITLPGRPDERTRTELKKAGFRWHNMRKVWYAKQTAERLQLAENIAERATETETAERVAELTAERINAVCDRYTVTATGTGLYAGWTGCNAGKYRDENELKKAILAELKKNGIKATARKGRGTWTTSFVFTVTVPEEMKRTEAEYIQTETEKTTFSRYWYTKPDGTEIHADALQDLPETERKEILTETAKREYAYAVSASRAEAVNPDFVRMVKAIVNSFNADHSNGMIDYFDRAFYDTYIWK